MSTTQKRRDAGRGLTGTDATGEVHPEAQVSFTAKLVILGEAFGADLSDYAGEPVLIFVAAPEEVRKAAPLFNRPVELRAAPGTVPAELRRQRDESDLATFKSTGFQHLDATIDRALEKAFKAGFDAGIEHQKKANPPPKARELAKQLDAARDAAAEALDSALTAFGQVQEQLAAVTDGRNALLDAAQAAIDEFAIGAFNPHRRQRVVEFIRAAIARAEGRS